MPLIRGCHAIDFDNNAAAYNTAILISRYGLLVNQTNYGICAWAYYVHMVPITRSLDPLVIFDVDDSYVQRFSIVLPQKPNYAAMKMVGPLHSYIPTSVVGFYNVPRLPSYGGSIGFF